MLYLAYGSNLTPARLSARVGNLDVLGTVPLPGYRLEFSKRGADGSGKCTLIAAPGSHAWGAIYRIADGAKATLDKIEGLGHGYDATWWDLPTFGECYVYLLGDGPPAHKYGTSSTGLSRVPASGDCP